MTDSSPAARADAVLAEATLAEKVGMTSGRGFFQAGGRRVWSARPYHDGSGVMLVGPSSVGPFLAADIPL